MTDTIADMLTRIRNAQMAGLRGLEIPFSKTKELSENYTVTQDVIDHTLQEPKSLRKEKKK